MGCYISREEEVRSQRDFAREEREEWRRRWQEEHDERIRLEERCKSLEAKAQAYKDMADEYYELWRALKEG